MYEPLPGQRKTIIHTWMEFYQRQRNVFFLNVELLNHIGIEKARKTPKIYCYFSNNTKSFYENLFRAKICFFDWLFRVLSVFGFVNHGENGICYQGGKVSFLNGLFAMLNLWEFGLGHFKNQIFGCRAFFSGSKYFWYR